MSAGAPTTTAIALGSEQIEVAVHRGDRRTTRLIVWPSGAVELRVPRTVGGSAVERFLHARRQWIVRQLDYFERFRPVDPPRRYVAGETIRYLGRQYRLRIEAGRHDQVESAALRGRHLVVTCAEEADRSDSEAIRRICRAWYATRARAVLARRVAGQAERLAGHGLKPPLIGIRWMTRRWGSCTKRGRILFNPALMIAPSDLVDYVVVHELCHTLHRHHGPAFYRLLTVVIPDWERRRRRLEPLGRYLSMV